MTTNNNSSCDVVLGAGAGASTYYCTKKFAPKFVNGNIMRAATSFTPDEKSVLKNSAEGVFKKSGLADKGVEYIHADENNRKVVTKNLLEKVEETVQEFIKKYINPKHKKKVKVVDNDSCVHGKIKRMIKLVSKGKNAFYHPFSKQIVINKKDFSFAAFHEMGHAINANKNIWTKLLHYGSYSSMFIAPFIVGLGLMKGKKQDGQKQEGFADRTGMFIKDNCGKLAFMSVIPLLAEEGIASIRGYNLAKNTLKQPLLNKLCKAYGLAWCTYLSTAVIIGAGANLAIRVKDKITQNKN